MRNQKHVKPILALTAISLMALAAPARADSEAGFIMIGSGSESGGVWSVGGENEDPGIHWGSGSESGGVYGTGAESDSGGVTQSESSSESGGASDAGSSSEATVGGGDSNWNNTSRYVQYYGR